MSAATPDVDAVSTAAQRIRAQIDLPAGVATWVLLAHLFTLFSPLFLLWSVHVAGDRLDVFLSAPFALVVAATFFLVGSAFEIAQNTVDRWYYTGPYAAFSDLLFNTCIALGLGAFALAGGVVWWIVALVAIASIAFPVLYLTDRVPYPATGVLGILGVGVLAVGLDQPIVWLMLVFSTGLNLYFLALIVRTHAQSLHGGIALTNGLGLLTVPIAIQGALDGGGPGWPLTIALAVALTVSAAAAWPFLARLQPTAPPSGEAKVHRTLM